MKKKSKMQGGGSEGEEYVACSSKAMTSSEIFWRHLNSTEVKTNIQEAIDSLD